MPFWKKQKKKGTEPLAEEAKSKEEPLDAKGNVKVDIQETLLNEPEVQAAMRKAGEEALKNEAVQQAIIQAAKENLTQENAMKVAGKAKEWAEDPEVQAKARHFAGMAMVAAGQAGQTIIGVIEQGPAGLRVLAFIAGSLSCANAFLQVLSKLTGLDFLWCLIAVFQVVFSLTTMIFEADPDTVSKVDFVSSYQDMLIEYCKFLTVVTGRGLFYIFQGLLWLAQVQVTVGSLLNIFVGCFLIFVGFLNCLIHFGIMPEHIASKAQQIQETASGYM
mmetsp:Transcript_2442/g.5192  ORF Transcript_2442/g.5192 Transcript_2442/m.5192 type:complete len:275 (-) Transcript_2442:288-1112(-)